MITIKEYILPNTIDEAYKILTSKKSTMIFGGGAFIRMGSKNIALGIDLSRAGMRYIKENDSSIEIGAMTTFGDIERSDILNKFSNGLLPISVKDIVGVQLRNIVTVGGTVYSRYGFSDFLTALMVLDTKVKLYKGGVRTLEEFMRKGSQDKDILEKIIIQKESKASSYSSMRNSRGDYPILNLAMSKDTKGFKIAVGARPQRAVLAKETMGFISEYRSQINDEVIEKACNIIQDEISFGSNSRGSNLYRRHICKVLFKRALKEVMTYED